MDRKRKSFMDDYSFEDHGVNKQDEEEESNEDEMIEEESRSSKVKDFKKNVKVMYVQKLEGDDEGLSR